MESTLEIMNLFIVYASERNDVQNASSQQYWNHGMTFFENEGFPYITLIVFLTNPSRMVPLVRSKENDL